MKNEFLTNLPPIGESVAKMASDGGQLLADILSIYGFFAICLLFVGFALIVPVRIYEKYYHVADDVSTIGYNLDKNEQQEANNQAA